MSKKKDITEKDFLKDDFIHEQKYLPYEEEPEVIEARTKQEKSAWREVYAFAHMINRAGREYTETDILNQCNQFYLSKEKVEKVFKKIFNENKEAFGIDDKPEIFKVEYFLKQNWLFVRNEITQRAEYKPVKSEKDFEKLNEHSIYRKLQHANFRFSMEKLKSLLKSDFMKSYNAFQDYFNNLEEWDYETDYIGKLANYIKATNQEFHVTQFRKMLVRSVGCALYGVENRFVYVLIGEKQEKGKSTFIRFLNPFGDRYYTESPIRDNKDTYFAFSENFIYNLEELASASNIEVNHLKAIISMSVIKERKAFEVNPEEQPRRCNFFASTNKNEFLTDSENTRWLCINVEDIDWKYKQEIDISKVWAQAFALYHDKNYNQHLTIEETQLRDKMNKEFEITDIEKDLIKQCFEVVAKDDKLAMFYSNPDILLALQDKFQGKTLNPKFISKSMIQLGFERGSARINGHKTRGYYVKPLFFAEYKSDSDSKSEPVKQKKDGEQSEIKFKF